MCGTDLHIFEGTQPYFEYPRVIGHELAGEIAAVAGPSRFCVGQPVAVLPYLTCGQCVACRRGKPNCCQRANVIGVHSDGGFADWLAVPEDNLVDAEGVDFDQAAMVEFLAIGAHAARRGAIERGQKVAVVGAGPIGLATAIFVRSLGGAVTMLDTRADRLAFARDAIGLDQTIEAGEGAGERCSALTGGDFFDCVFDCTGSPKAMNAGFSLVAHGGAYVLVSIVLGDVTFADPEFHKREVTLLGSRNATRTDFDTVLAAIRSGAIPSKVLATHRATLEEAARAFLLGLTPPAAWSRR